MSGHRKIPWRGAQRYEDFRQKTVVRFTNPERDAKNHIEGRNGSVAQVLCYLSMIHNAGQIPHPAITAVGAGYQATGGSKTDNTEAAHCLPCGIKIAGHDPAELTINPKAQKSIRSLFANVTVLPKCFNVADSTAEQGNGGLIMAFVGACTLAVNCARESMTPQSKLFRHTGERYEETYHLDVWPINRAQVDLAYKSWLALAEQAYVNAGDAVEAGRYLSKGDDPDEIVWLLSKYLEYHADESSVHLRPDRLTNLELDFNS